MEKEQIIKVLESIVGKEEDFCEICPYRGYYCDRLVLCDAIALIKELTEESEKLKSIGISKDIVIESLAEENERLKNICNSYALQYGTARDKEVFLRKEREDTVREFAERLKKECLVDSGYEVLQIGTIDRIAKEILGDEKK